MLAQYWTELNNKSLVFGLSESLRLSVAGHYLVSYYKFMKDKKTKTQTTNSPKRTDKSEALKAKLMLNSSYGKSPAKHPLSHLRSALIEDEDCLSKL